MLELIGAGKLHGLRIDHPDGLYDPRGYFERLQGAAEGRLRQVNSLRGLRIEPGRLLNLNTHLSPEIPHDFRETGSRDPAQK